MNFLQLANLEATRDLSRSILHCDMDMVRHLSFCFPGLPPIDHPNGAQFYAAVELHRDPSLKGKCFAVGSGVLVTASYEARKYGVRSGMAGFVAKALCPHLIFVSLNGAIGTQGKKYYSTGHLTLVVLVVGQKPDGRLCCRVKRVGAFLKSGPKNVRC